MLFQKLIFVSILKKHFENLIDTHFLAAKDVSVIESAFKEIESVSCIRFVRRFLELDFIELKNGGGCSSNVGRVGGRQIVTLTNSESQYHCMHTGTIVHELLHAIGFWHMQSSNDRDKYIKINYENIVSGSQNNFEKYESTRFNTPYDLKSIMHYGAFYFSKNKKPTMEPRDKDVPLSALGQRKQMTAGDIERLNLMYQCEI